MSSARKFLALAISAYRSKQYEEAGVLLAQAASSPEAEALATELSASENDLPVAGVEATDVSETAAEDELSETEEAIPIEEPKDVGSQQVSVEASDDDWDEVVDEELSVSSVTRRKTTSLFHIGKIIAASMSAAEPDEEDSEDEDTDSGESDPDFEGEEFVPASFSSIKVKSVVKSPVKLRQ